jgi:hypothetical protein
VTRPRLAPSDLCASVDARNESEQAALTATKSIYEAFNYRCRAAIPVSVDRRVGGSSGEALGGGVDEEVFNMSVRNFLKQLGFEPATSRV